MKSILGAGILAVLVSVQVYSSPAYSYDPCDVRMAFKSFAESRCHRLVRDAGTTHESWTLSAVTLTQNLATVNEKDSVVVIPGGPGTDAQGIALGLNEKGILDALWKHLHLNVILFDPRGTGQSQLPQAPEFYGPEMFTTDLQVQDLRRVIEATSPARPVFLLAHSAGGNIAAKYAALYPERVKGLILYSASIDTREIGESNLRIFAQESPQWQEYLQTCPSAVSKDLSAKNEQVEFFLRNVLKLQRLANVRPSSLQSRFYLKDYRVEMISAIENDRACSSRVPETLARWMERIQKLPPEIQKAVTEMRDVKFDPQTHEPPSLKRGTWIKTAVICSEGLTRAEMKQELWLEGLDFSQDTCHRVEAFFPMPPARAWLAQIRTPTLLIGGTEDAFQIPSAVKRNSQGIVGSELKMILGGGHESHRTHAMEFYGALEGFILKVQRTAKSQ